MATAVKSAGHITVSYNSHDVTDYMSQADLAMTVAELDATVMSSTATEFVPGLADNKLDLTFNKVDSTLIGWLLPDITSPGTLRTCVVTITDSASVATVLTWTSNAFLTNFSISGSASALVSAKPAIRLNGAPGVS